MIDKQKIIDNICYTELVYGRINKKLKLNLSKEEIEIYIFKILNKTPIDCWIKKGKNYYISNNKEKVRITINSFTFRIITVDRI